MSNNLSIKLVTQRRHTLNSNRVEFNRVISRSPNLREGLRRLAESRGIDLGAESRQLITTQAILEDRTSGRPSEAEILESGACAFLEVAEETARQIANSNFGRQSGIATRQARHNLGQRTLVLDILNRMGLVRRVRGSGHYQFISGGMRELDRILDQIQIERISSETPRRMTSLQPINRRALVPTLWEMLASMRK